MLYPALDIGGVDGEIALAIADDYSPTAVEESDGFLTIYFSDSTLRDAARHALARAFPASRVAERDVDDGDWARRSQEHLGPVTVGRITVAPPWVRAPGAAWPRALPMTVLIQPSMGFGTGHHATTRLCLAALQTLDLANRSVLDIGTGSGVLAIAARMLGARHVVGVDIDPDAVRCARENLTLNPGVDLIAFDSGDLTSAHLPTSDVITANLTGALLCRGAPAIAAALAPGGGLIISGLLARERGDVVAAFQPAEPIWEREEEDWLGLAFEERRLGKKS